jgi:hypothetical protein
MEQVDNWRKSSRSSANGGECVEAGSAHGIVAVRDTVQRDGVTLTVPAGAWTVLLGTLR